MKRIVVGALFLLTVSAAAAQDNVEHFLRKHWAFPIPSQGTPPKSYTGLEASLAPESCGTCHPKQYEGWRNSRHALAMGPGIMGQLFEYKPNAIGKLRDCTRCHSPLAEQEDSLRKQLQGVKAASSLHEKGLVCAACHVRHNVRYGPPPLKPIPQGMLPHGGFVRSPAFMDSRFCASCHQFGQDGYVLNGKPLENTYAEWKSSKFAKQGTQCQGCHMPNRQHLWKGIHDEGMTRQAVTIDPSPPILHNGQIQARLVLTNTGAGHDFPTYITPMILVRIFQTSSDGRLISGTMRQKIIARQLSNDQSRELSDTRLAPGKKLILNYQMPLNSGSSALVMQVRVEPDHYYTGFYRSILDTQTIDKGTRLIRDALKDSIYSAYDLYNRRYDLSLISNSSQNPPSLR